MSSLFSDIILPALLNGTVISLVVAVVVGVIVGTIIGIISQSFGKSITQAIVGAFFGMLLIAVLPIFSKPEIMGSGPYGGITILQMAIVLVPLGSIGGALVGALSKLKLDHPRHQRNLLLLLVVSYVLITCITYGRIIHYCQQLHPFQRAFPPEFCKGLAFEGGGESMYLDAGLSGYSTGLIAPQTPQTLNLRRQGSDDYRRHQVMRLTTSGVAKGMRPEMMDILLGFIKILKDG